MQLYYTATWFACSDGVTVDTTPPHAAAVYLGGFGTEGLPFHTLTSEFSILWGHFIDVEETVR